MSTWRGSYLRSVAAFIDRDGTICKHVPYLSSVDNVELRPTVASGIRRLNDAQIPVIVVTNQSGIGRGYFDRADAEAIHSEIVDRLGAENATLDDIYLCPHHPDDGCDCRKPEPGMLREASAAHGVALEGSYVIGDRWSDIEAGRRVGCTTILFPSTETSRDPAEIDADHTVQSFEAAASIVASGRSESGQ